MKTFVKNLLLSRSSECMEAHKEPYANHFITRTKLKWFEAQVSCAVALGIGSFFSLAAAPQDSAVTPPAKPSQAIPWSQVRAKAGAEYRGDGLTIIPTAEGARLRCVFQRLEGEVTREGLWLTSTVTNAMNDRFRIVAAAVGREVKNVERETSEGVQRGAFVRRSDALTLYAPSLPDAGTVAIDAQTVRFTRRGLVEEYSVSIDGVRQDFVVVDRPAGAGELQVRLVVSGAKVEPTPGGVRLVLQNSGRKIAYSRLRVTDAMGKELNARMEVIEEGARRSCGVDLANGECISAWSARPTNAGTPNAALAVVVEDAEAIYPIRIDPTFSDANWISMNPGIPGAAGDIYAAAVDASGNLYIGGDFSLVGDVLANRIAKWNGNNWSTLGSGLGSSDSSADSSVYTLAVSGSNVYAGGYFTLAGGVAANHIAKWNGNGSGMDDNVLALAVSGSDLYAGGNFTMAGGSEANHIAKWDGNSWSALGSGMAGVDYASVKALAVSGSDIYAGGHFTTAGGIAATNIAIWDGNSWSALGSGINGNVVNALAVLGSQVYVGGEFWSAGGSAAESIAKWDGNSWSALGSGMNGSVGALAVSGSDLYVGGGFTTVGGNGTNYIAKWNGSSWTALGSGIDGAVLALAVSGSDLYVGGGFLTAGGKLSPEIARAYLPALPALSVLRSGTNVIVSWPSVDTASFSLEQAGTLSTPASWVTNTAIITDDGTNKSVTLPATNRQQFFRLRGP